MTPAELWAQVRTARYGGAAFLFEWEEARAELTERLWALDRRWRAARPETIADLIVGQNSVVATLRGVDADPVVRWVEEAFLTAPAPDRGTSHRIAVVYDGEDLAEVAETLGLDPEAVAARHAASVFRVGWVGFLPGFAYLTGLDPGLVLPRRAAVRPKVPAGAVAVADAMSAVYPLSSPGGWHLIGRTAKPLLTPAGPRLTLLEPGDTVRFVRDD